MILKNIFRRIFGKIILSKQKQQPATIVMVDGGLGSQLNKFIIGKLIQSKTDVEVKYDLSWFDECGKSIDDKNNRFFELTNVFPDIDFPIASREEVDFYKKHFRYRNKCHLVFNKKVFEKSSPFYVDGYFGHWKYLKEFEDMALNKPCFDLKLSDNNQKIFDDIANHECSVAVHIRRGDYIDSIHDVLTAEYFINAINYMKKLCSNQNTKFFIFSNGMGWVKEEIIPQLSKDTNLFLVEANDNDSGAYDFYLLTKCKHQIISNASFGFLGAFLNQNEDKKVIIPQAWFRKKRKSKEVDRNSGKAFRFPGWMVMSNEGNIV